ncbi:MAG: hypothetical protein BWY27_01123 [Bacteroidetes bacterium ADurb.Bin234]|nr:MAG: hypothetical protein BWY27_01123 [Bacteroidetes bacterium ADurb.Bin234]
MLNKKTILIAFIVLFVVMVAVFIILKFRNANEFKNDINDTNPKNPQHDNGSSEKKPTPVAATDITTPSVNKILYTALSQTGSLPISKGQKSKAVYLLQYVLNALYNAGLKLDGDFGPKTQTALATHTGRTFADGDLILALNAEMQKYKSKIKNFDFYTTEGGKIFRGTLKILPYNP